MALLLYLRSCGNRDDGMLKQPIALDAAQILGGLGGTAGRVVAGIKGPFTALTPARTPLPTLLAAAAKPALASPTPSGPAQAQATAADAKAA